MRNLIKEVKDRSIAAILSGLLTAGCAGLPPLVGSPQDRDMDYLLEEGKETASEGKSDYTVILFPDDKGSYGCQANTYLALEKLILLGDVKFIAREGRVGFTEHDNEAFGTMRYFDHELKPHHYRTFLKLSLAQRQQTANSWVQNHQFPSQYRHDGWADKPSRNWREVLPMMSTVLSEAVYQDKVITLGAEDQKALDKADEELAKAEAVYRKADREAKDDQARKEAENAFLAVRDEQIGYRNKAMVENIQSYAGGFKEGHLIPFHVGVLHITDLAERFKEKGVSYKIVEFGACKGE